MALYKHTLRGTYTGESWSFSIHTTGVEGIDDAQTAWGVALTTFATVDYLADLPPEVAFIEASTAEITIATGVQVTRRSDTRTEVGTSAADGLPCQIAPVVSLRTDLATRAGRGRFYAPSPAVDTQVQGRMGATAQGHLADAASDMLSSLLGDGYVPVLYSRTTHTTNEITSLDVGDVLDTQRRRRSKLVEVRTSRTV